MKTTYSMLFYPLMLAIAMANGACADELSVERRDPVVVDRHAPELNSAVGKLTTHIATPHYNVKLTGVMQQASQRIALIMVRSAGSQARHYALAETEKEDELEVLSIDVTEGVVKAHHRGVEILLSFASQVKQEAATRIAEQNVDRDHVRAHEIREAKERERIDRERAAVETELAFFVKAP